MHRPIRCAVTLIATLAMASSVPLYTASAQVDQKPVPIEDPAPKIPAHLGKAVPSKKHAPAKKPAAPTDRLDVRLKLGDGKRVWRPTRRQVGVAYAPGSNSSESGTGPVRFVVDPVPLKKYLMAIAPYVRRQPVNAGVVVDKSNITDSNAEQMPAKIVPEQPGAILDTDAATKAIQSAIQQDPGTLHVVLPLKTSPARRQASQLNGIDSRIGYFVTRFNPGEVGRTQTVRRAISIIDGTVVAPGQTFSINQAVGERTAERGFGMGHVFLDGKMEKQLGGGMCQVATTLFNAAMLADIKIVERHQHVRTVPYVPPGRDATVYWGQKDFKINNDTAWPIFISYKTTRNHAIVSLFGHGMPGRKVTLVNHYQRLGERHFTGVFYRVIHRGDGTVQKDPPFRSAYKWTPALDYTH